MGAIATFDYPTFVARYPEFASVSQTLIAAYFAEATLYLANDGSGPVTDAGQQLVLLNMLTAHIAKLNATITLANGQQAAPSDLVGRISSASEGSVSVSTDMGALPGSAVWFAQTRYGFEYWSATAPYRTMRYVPRPRPGLPFGPGYPCVGGGAGLPWFR